MSHVLRRVNGDGSEGDYLASYDPDNPEEPYAGSIEWTDDPARAMLFTDGGDAMLAWRATSTIVPTRPDGRPNRPLSAYTVITQKAP